MVIDYSSKTRIDIKLPCSHGTTSSTTMILIHDETSDEFLIVMNDGSQRYIKSINTDDQQDHNAVAAIKLSKPVKL